VSEPPTDKPNDPETPEGEPSAPAPTSELTQEELARRVDALAKDEDAGERLARVEEQKLADRRAAQKAKGKRSGLEVAASKRLARIGEKVSSGGATARAVPATAAERDALLDRTASLGKWFEKNSKVLGWAVFGVLVVAAGLLAMRSMRERTEAKASEELSQAVLAQNGRVGAPDKEADVRFKDPTPIFKTADERREAALKQYRDVVTKYRGTGAAILARLSEASILLDTRDADGAIAAYREVKDSALGKADVDVRARAMEGIGFGHELKSQWDEALAAFTELEATEALGFKELGMYHQARVLEQKGDKEKAKELLKAVHERVSKPESPMKNLERVAEDRLRALDPQALPPKPTAPPDIQRMIEQMRMGGGAGGAPGKLAFPPQGGGH